MKIFGTRLGKWLCYKLWKSEIKHIESNMEQVQNFWQYRMHISQYLYDERIKPSDKLKACAQLVGFNPPDPVKLIKPFSRKINKTTKPGAKIMGIDEARKAVASEG